QDSWPTASCFISSAIAALSATLRKFRPCRLICILTQPGCKPELLQKDGGKCQPQQCLPQSTWSSACAATNKDSKPPSSSPKSCLPTTAQRRLRRPTAY